MKTTVVHIRDVDLDDPDVLYIGRAMPRRGLAGSPFANPFHIGRDGTRSEVVEKFRAYLLHRPRLLAALAELKGKRLACWCAPLLCHGDVLVEFVDAAQAPAAVAPEDGEEGT